MTLEGGLRILLADDHAVLRAGLRRLFESAGARVVGEAETGEQACQLHAELQPQVLVMDLSMPGMGGIEALRRVLAIDPGHPRAFKVAAAALTASAPWPTTRATSPPAALAASATWPTIGRPAIDPSKGETTATVSSRPVSFDRVRW